MQSKIIEKARQVIDLSIEKKVRLGTAESCTGGMIGVALTAISGSSATYMGGIIAYDNSIKNMQLNVPPGMIHKYGAVSKYVAECMAKNAAKNLNTNIAVSVTGIAGPSGGSKDKPVGTVYIGLAVRRNDNIKTIVKLYQFGDIGREKMRRKTCQKALKLMLVALEQY